MEDNILNPKISLIIPVYNVEKYLSKCLDSILNQTLKDIEIICINDGSTDRSSIILGGYEKKDSRVKIINQENQGISVARNVGLSISKGEYITFLDSDDYLNNIDYLEKMYQSAKNNDADIAVAGIIRGNDRYKINLIEYNQETVTDNYNQKLEICNVPECCFVWNKIYKREKLLDTNLKFTPGLIYEDIVFTPKALFYLGKLVTVVGVQYFYFRHSNTIVAKSNKKAKSDYKYAKSIMYKFFKDNNIDISTMDKVVKKIKIFGLTLFKTITKGDNKKFVLLNCIKWEKRN